MHLHGRPALLVSSTSWTGLGTLPSPGACPGTWLSLCSPPNVFGDTGAPMREGTALSWEEKHLENGHDTVLFSCRG